MSIERIGGARTGSGGQRCHQMLPARVYVQSMLMIGAKVEIEVSALQPARCME